MSPIFGAIENDRLSGNGQRKSCLELCDTTLPSLVEPHPHKCGQCEIGWVHYSARLIGRIRESPFFVGSCQMNHVDVEHSGSPWLAHNYPRSLMSKNLYDSDPHLDHHLKRNNDNPFKGRYIHN